MTATMTLWCVGRYFRASVEPEGAVWELLGIFSKREDAEARCKQREDFVAPAGLNMMFPEETTSWPECYYPVAGQTYEGEGDE